MSRYKFSICFRRKPNESGTFGIQVVEKRDGENVVIQRIGTSGDEIELCQLERKAQPWIDDRRGPKLPLTWEKNDSAEVKKKNLSMNLCDGQMRSFKRKDGRHMVVPMNGKRVKNDTKNRYY